MKKLFCAAFALALTAAMLTGCRSNVSDHKNGRITEPTMLPETIATMPGTDTTPTISTEPVVTTKPSAATQPTHDATHPTMDETTESTAGKDSAADDHGSAPGAKARPHRNMG